ncbi:hypothetical protein ACERK3_17465 [Phycisphaerales bacterium AB-hyl4]|uniref:Uncharacterized protein n=1 Tax=Natronomicrosphaera hydrolytica TaxID=3242702 RepID=A0ABV4U939_9BACT
MPRDGLVGDRLSQVMIAVRGEEVRIANFRLVNYAEPVHELLSAEVETFDAPVQEYPHMDEIFPFGVITTVGAGNVVNGRFFDQSREERVAHDLLDIRRHHFNVWSNFVDNRDVDAHLEVTGKYDLKLIETAYSNDNKAEMPDDHPVIESIRSREGDDRLLAWYGKDEPTDTRAYIENKMRVNQEDPTRPYVSAFANPHIVQTLGPYVEFLIIDPYVLEPGVDGAAALMNVTRDIEQARTVAPDARTWVIPQAYSRRRGRSVTLREPVPEEIRMSVFSGLASGARGFIFFLYNDTVTYLDGTHRSEEFDHTMVDPWGNALPMHTEAGNLAKALIPVMPEVLQHGEQTTDLEEIGIRLEGRALVDVTTGERGDFLILANRHIDRRLAATLQAADPGKGNFYDLLSLERIDTDGQANVNLAEGGGVILFRGSSSEFDAMRQRIETRQHERALGLLRVETDVLRRAGFDTTSLDKLFEQPPTAESVATIEQALEALKQSQPTYVEGKQALAEVQRGFGENHNKIIDVIVRVDATENAQWHEVFEEIKDQSREYYAIRREWERGEFDRLGELDAIRDRQQELGQRIDQLIAERIF